MLYELIFLHVDLEYNNLDKIKISIVCFPRCWRGGLDFVMVLKILVLYEVDFSCFDFFLSQIQLKENIERLCGMLCSAGKERETKEYKVRLAKVGATSTLFPLFTEF